MKPQIKFYCFICNEKFFSNEYKVVREGSRYRAAGKHSCGTKVSAMIKKTLGEQIMRESS